MSKADKKEDKSWQKIQDKLAEKSGLAIVLVEDVGLSDIAESNNNSICQLLTKDEKFAPKCQKFCGRVYKKATEANKPLKYKCHAGLECVAVPIKVGNNKEFVAITGRTFVKSDGYKTATERAISGDWNKFPPTHFFENLILTSSLKSLESLGKELSNLSDEEKQLLSNLASEKIGLKSEPSPESLKSRTRVETKTKLEGKEDERAKEPKAQQEDEVSTTKKKIQYQKNQTIQPSKVLSNKSDINEKPKGENRNAKSKPKNTVVQKNSDESKELAEWRSFFNSLPNLEYLDACRSVLEFLKKRYDISSLAWLENRDNNLQKILAIGKLELQEIQISMAIDDERFIKLLEKESSIELKERDKTEKGLESQRIRLFPISVGGEIRSGLVIGEKADDKKLKHSIARFCDNVAIELEILRLREELTKSSWLEIAVQKFNNSLKMIDDDGFWSRLMETTAELLQAERGSLLVFDEKEDEFVVKSAIGSKANFIKNIKSNLGSKVALDVWEKGKPLVVRNIHTTSVEPAPDDWKYKTESFISYPISIGERKIGVINLADKVDGNSYNEFDLQLLQKIIPQIAVAIDHATLKNKAGEFEQLSVTDSLTGLLNRRYLEERLSEEINRSNRHGYPMSFLMIDVDDFGDYNNEFLHTEGDKALRIVGQCLRETLRGADIAARFGGEEFSILLPQTTLDEAEIIAERIRNNIATTRFPNRQVTVSIGIACISLAIDNVSELIKSADTALYVAKEKGKNNVQIFEDQRKEMRLPN